MEVRRTDKKEMISVEITLTKEQWDTLHALISTSAAPWMNDLHDKIRSAVWPETATLEYAADQIKAQSTAGTGQV